MEDLEVKTVDIPATEVEAEPAPVVQEVKKFTEDEVNAIVVNRLKKEQAKFLKKLGVEDESKIDELLARASEAVELKEKVTRYEADSIVQSNIAALRKLNVDETFLEFVMSKVESGDKFEENAKTFVEANPRLLKERFEPVNSGLSLQGSSGSPDISKMSASEYRDWRNKKNK